MIMPWELGLMVPWEAIIFAGALGILAAVVHWIHHTLKDAEARADTKKHLFSTRKRSRC